MGSQRGVIDGVAVGVAWLLVGIIVWSVGAFGIARGLEDRCLHVSGDHDYGASSQSASVWPPDFTCELMDPDDPAAADPLEVSQEGVALLRSGWLLGFPVAWLVLGAAVRLRRSSKAAHRQPPSDHHRVSRR